MLEGNIDQADRDALRGWVRNPDDPDTPISIAVSVNGEFGTRVLANTYRYDLEQSGMGLGRYGFLVNLQGLSPTIRYTFQLQREDTGEDIPGSPVTLEPLTRFDAPAQAELAQVLGVVDTDEELKQRIGFLAGQLDRLQQMLADRQGQRALRDAHHQFRRRWAPAPGETPPPELPPLQKRALFIDSTAPAMSRDAGSSALLSHMQSLQRLGFTVTFVPADMNGFVDGALDQAGIDTRGLPWGGSVEEVLRREAGLFDLVYLHRVANARYIPLIRSHQPRARLVFSVADLHHLRMARQAEVEERPELIDHSRNLRHAEMNAARGSDAVITHSSFEAMLLRLDLPASHVHVVPWAVPPRPVSTPFAERSGVAFIGGYHHPPNVDAAHWLVQKVMPLVWRYSPDMQCTLAGSNMPDSLRTLNHPRVTAVGHVPDLAGLFDTVRLTVAPLGFGAGVKGKVLDSLAAGVPCACTPVAAEGIDLPALLQAQIAASPEGLAGIIHRLHTDEAMNRVCSAAGLAFVTETFSAEKVDAQMRKAAGLKED